MNNSDHENRLAFLAEGGFALPVEYREAVEWALREIEKADASRMRAVDAMQTACLQLVDRAIAEAQPNGILDAIDQAAGVVPSSAPVVAALRRLREQMRPDEDKQR